MSIELATREAGRSLSAQRIRPNSIEEFLERAAIIEYCGNVPRAEAERLAREQLSKRKK